MRIGLMVLALGILAHCATAFAAQDRTLMLMNNSAVEVTYFKVSPSDGSAPPTDVLSGQGLGVGENRKVTIVSATDECTFNLEIVFSGEDPVKREVVDFCNTDGYIIEK